MCCGGADPVDEVLLDRSPANVWVGWIGCVCVGLKTARHTRFSCGHAL